MYALMFVYILTGCRYCRVNLTPIFNYYSHAEWVVFFWVVWIIIQNHVAILLFHLKKLMGCTCACSTMWCNLIIYHRKKCTIMTIIYKYNRMFNKNFRVVTCTDLTFGLIYIIIFYEFNYHFILTTLLEITLIWTLACNNVTKAEY